MDRFFHSLYSPALHVPSAGWKAELRLGRGVGLPRDPGCRKGLACVLMKSISDIWKLHVINFCVYLHTFKITLYTCVHCENLREMCTAATVCVCVCVGSCLPTHQHWLQMADNLTTSFNWSSLTKYVTFTYIYSTYSVYMWNIHLGTETCRRVRVSAGGFCALLVSEAWSTRRCFPPTRQGQEVSGSTLEQDWI